VLTVNGIPQALHLFLQALQSARLTLIFFFSPFFRRMSFHRGWTFCIHLRVEKSRASGWFVYRSMRAVFLDVLPRGHAAYCPAGCLSVVRTSAPAPIDGPVDTRSRCRNNSAPEARKELAQGGTLGSVKKNGSPGGGDTYHFTRLTQFLPRDERLQLLPHLRRLFFPLRLPSTYALG